MSADLTSGLALPQRLALAYCPDRARPATLALLALDARLAAMLKSRREPLACQLRLAWWRDMLGQSQADWPLGEPVIEALRTWREPAGLEALVNGWEALLTERLSPPTIAEFVDGRGKAFGALATELGVLPNDAAQAARIWALADLAAHLSDSAEQALVLEHAGPLTVPKLPKPLRPLAVLAGLGARALRLGGAALLDGPGAMLLALRIGLTGR